MQYNCIDNILMLNKILTIGYLLLLLGVACSFIIEQNQSKSKIIQSVSNLGFGNQTGSNTTQAEVSTFINFINTASIAYRDDPYSRFIYISDKMNTTYGVPYYGYSVIQQGNDGFGFAIRSQTNNYASVAPGTDLIFLNNSYMFLREKFQTGRAYIFEPGQKGNVDVVLENKINEILLSVQTADKCTTCSGSKTIANKLSDSGLGDWNVFCSASSNLYLMVYSYDAKYIYSKPKNCYYGLYYINK